MANTVNDRRRGVTLGILLGIWTIGPAPLAGAQEAARETAQEATQEAVHEAASRWAPWVGCWRTLEETAGAPPLLCVVPIDGNEAIEMLTVLDGRVVSRESIFADGKRHEVDREECRGWEWAEFSDDSYRIYTRSELDCGAGTHRSSSGVISMVSPTEWLDLRTVDVDGQSAPWAARYRLASQADFHAAGQGDLVGAQGSETLKVRLAASIPVSIKDVIEAHGKLSPEAVQLWVVERGEPFDLNATRLIEMAEAGVPPSVIDVIVAVSYPEKFVVNDAVGRRSAAAGRGGSSLAIDRGLNPFETRTSDPFSDPFYDPYTRNGYRSSYGSPGSRYGPGTTSYGGYGYGFSGYGVGFGIGYGGGLGGYGFGGYNPGFGGFGTPVISVGRRSPYGPTEGRVVRGGGYTSAASGSGSRGAGRSARPRSSGSSGSSAPAAAPRSSSPSPQSTGRRAQPRSRN